MKITLELNGQTREADVEERTLLADMIRDVFGLTGTHVGCDTSQCGCCTIELDGAMVKSCAMLAAQADGAAIVTIEGLAKDGKLHPMQQAFTECHGLQCGFCTPGMIMASIGILRDHPNPSDADITKGLEGNLCRCTGYVNIVKSVHRAAELMRG